MKNLGEIESWGTGGPDYANYLDYYGGIPYVEEGIIDTAGEPKIINVYEKLNHNAHSGTILNKGPGILYVYLSSDGENYTDVIELDENQFLDLGKEDVYSIKLDTDTSGNAYKIIVH